MATKTLTPLPGYAFIRLEGAIITTLILSDKSAEMPGYIGRIKAITHRDNRRHDLKAKDRVLVRALGGTPLLGDESYQRFPIKHIEAILPEVMKVKMNRNITPRCRSCGEANGSGQNVMLTETKSGKLYCPRCEKDEYGRSYDPNATPEMTQKMAQMLSGGVLDPNRPIGIA